MFLLTQDPPQYPCEVCCKAVRWNSKAIECDTCAIWTHLACQSQITNSQYTQNDSLNFICNSCLLKELPNFSSSDSETSTDSDTSQDNILDSNISSSSDDSNTTDYDQYDCFKQRGLHFIHLNARSLIPKLDELHLLAKSTSAAAIAVSLLYDQY